MNLIDPLNTHTVSAASAATSRGGGAKGDFAETLSAAMTRALSENALSAYGAAAPALPGDSLGNLQSMLLSGAAEGQSDSNAMLMYMLISMMQEFKNSDLTPLMTVMAALTPAGASSAAGPYNPSFLPSQAWLPTSLNSVSTAGSRSAETLNKVISQFKVESAARYQPRNGNTYCNIYVWDVTRALGCEIPHYVERSSGQPRYYPDVKGASELDANGAYDWLRQHGADYGWREISASEAQHFANNGFPVVSAWRNNSGGAGHVQMVCPSRNGGYDPIRGVTVAQAGSRNTSYAHINATMSADKVAQARYYVHA